MTEKKKRVEKPLTSKQKEHTPPPAVAAYPIKGTANPFFKSVLPPSQMGSEINDQRIILPEGVEAPDSQMATPDNSTAVAAEEARQMEVECAVMAARIYDRMADIQKLRIENDQLSAELRQVVAKLGAA